MTTKVPTVQDLLTGLLSRYAPGGEFGKGQEALLGRAKTKGIADISQGLVSAGLAGTTIAAGAGKKWEEEVGMPARLQMEDIRSQRYSDVALNLAGYLERKETTNLQIAEQRRKETLAANAAVQAQNRINEAESKNYMQKLFPDMFGSSTPTPTKSTASTSIYGLTPPSLGNVTNDTPWPTYAAGTGTYYGAAAKGPTTPLEAYADYFGY